MNARCKNIYFDTINMNIEYKNETFRECFFCEFTNLCKKEINGSFVLGKNIKECVKICQRTVENCQNQIQLLMIDLQIKEIVPSIYEEVMTITEKIAHLTGKGAFFQIFEKIFLENFINMRYKKYLCKKFLKYTKFFVKKANKIEELERNLFKQDLFCHKIYLEELNSVDFYNNEMIFFYSFIEKTKTYIDIMTKKEQDIGYSVGQWMELFEKHILYLDETNENNETFYINKGHKLLYTVCYKLYYEYSTYDYVSNRSINIQFKRLLKYAKRSLTNLKLGPSVLKNSQSVKF